ncbi:hypothetical protein BY996DRAFT_3976411 [Phakopsora pachyrhizi]|nr:hypothetical protein BY996DRAFT_3976411 [Phakopsora pachyrhizi]
MVLLGSSHSSMSQSLKAFPTLEFLKPWIISLFGGTLVWTILDLIGCSVRFYRISSDKLFEQLQKIFHVDEQKKDKDCHEGAQGKKIEGEKNSSGELSTVVGEDEEDEFWFDRPYLSNSLRDFWSNRWHSQLKQIFVEFGSNPIQYLSINLLGIRSRNLLRILRVFGAFFISGLFHELGLWYATKLDKKLNNLKFFTMQAVGIVLESLFEKIFCKQVGGFYGRIWSLGWVLLWGRLMIFSYIDHKVIDLDLIYLGLFKEDYEFQGGVRGGTTYLFGKTLEFYLLNPILIRVLF